jgi:hypothetical protein
LKLAQERMDIVEKQITDLDQSNGTKFKIILHNGELRFIPFTTTQELEPTVSYFGQVIH